jgi:hypothetical protein
MGLRGLPSRVRATYTENAVESTGNWDNNKYSTYIQDNWRAYGATNLPLHASPTLNSVSLSNPGLRLATGATITAAALPVLPVQVTGIQLAN